jgi:hypothetical protein
LVNRSPCFGLGEPQFLQQKLSDLARYSFQAKASVALENRVVGGDLLCKLKQLLADVTGGVPRRFG